MPVVSLSLPDEPGAWMTLSAAADRLGWHLHRVQSRARRDGWPRRAANRGRAPEYLVPAALLTEPAAPMTESTQSTGESGAELAELATELRVGRDKALSALAELMAESTELRERTARAEGEVAGLRTTVDELRAAHTAETALLREALAKAEARADRLEAALVEARRPLLLRLVDGLRRK